MTKKIKLLFILALLPTGTLAQDDCIFGQVDCAEPGRCSQYTDDNLNGLCDHSQPAEVLLEIQPTDEEIHDLISGQDLKTKTVKQIAAIYEINASDYAEQLSEYLGLKIKVTDSFQLLHDNYSLEPSVAKDIALGLKTGHELSPLQNKAKNDKKTYHLLLIFFILSFLYGLSSFLVKKQKINLVQHRKIWNLLLLLSFLASAFLGILLIIKVNFSLLLPLPFNILFWHVEIGIAMTAISIFHILWHWEYLKNIFKL